MNYSTNIYKLTKNFPNNEVFGLTSQLRRAAVSISANIAEGSGSSTIKEFKMYLDIAVKSALETVSLLTTSQRVNYITEEQRKSFYEDAEKLIRKIRSFKKSITISGSPQA